MIDSVKAKKKKKIDIVFPPEFPNVQSWVKFLEMRIASRINDQNEHLKAYDDDKSEAVNQFRRHDKRICIILNILDTLSELFGGFCAQCRTETFRHDLDTCRTTFMQHWKNDMRSSVTLSQISGEFACGSDSAEQIRLVHRCASFVPAASSHLGPDPVPSASQQCAEIRKALHSGPRTNSSSGGPRPKPKSAPVISSEREFPDLGQLRKPPDCSLAASSHLGPHPMPAAASHSGGLQGRGSVTTASSHSGPHPMPAAASYSGPTIHRVRILSVQIMTPDFSSKRDFPALGCTHSKTPRPKEDCSASTAHPSKTSQPKNACPVNRFALLSDE